MKQEQTFLNTCGQLSEIYPDIDGELCSKQSTLFGKLKQTFNRLYDGFEPTHYVIAQGIVNIMDNKQVSLSMALENGLTILISKTYPNSNIFINGNHFDQELIYNQTGQVEEGLCQYAEAIQILIKKATQRLKQTEFMGGIIYIHANIPQNLFQYRQALLVGIFLSILIINSNLEKTCLQDIIQMLYETGLLEEENLQKYFYDYKKRSLSLTAGVNNFQVPLDNNLKMILCRLDLARLDLEHNQSSRKILSEKKNEINLFLKKNFGVDSIYQAYEQQIVLKETQLPGDQSETKNVLDIEVKELTAVCDYSNKKIGIEKLLEEKWVIDSTMKCLYTPEVIQLVESLSERTSVKAYAIVQNQFVMLAVEKQKYAELICILRQLLNKGELKSKSFFKIDEQLIENRWSDDLQIGQKIFASAPSLSVGIFDPNEAIWFQ